MEGKTNGVQVMDNEAANGAVRTEAGVAIAAHLLESKEQDNLTGTREEARQEQSIACASV